MIISQKYAQQLVRAGQARIVGQTSGGNRWPDEPHYVIVERLDRQRTDHYEAPVTDHKSDERTT